jgi:cell division protein FtsL
VALSDVLSDDLVEVVRVLVVPLVCALWVVIGVLRCRQLVAKVREIGR